MDVHAHYLGRGSGKRGWGDLDLEHPHTFHARGPFVRDLLAGWALAGTPGLSGAVVLGYNRAIAIGLLLGCRVRRIPVFTLSDSDEVQQKQQPLIKRVAKQVALRLMFARDTRVWTISKSNAEYWRRHGLRNQRHIPFESPVPDVGDPAEGPRETKVVLYVGRFAESKGTADAVEAVRLVNKTGLKTTLRLVGLGDLHGVDTTGEDGFIDIVGPVEHAKLSHEYLGADCLVVPSRAEPFGLVVREALQFGLPVVATSGVPAAVELCNLGWNIVPPGDSPAMAEALRHVLTSGVRWPERPPVDTCRLYYEELSTQLGRGG
jgi:glycosyltransferase involved in cell wall biosynthesis